MIFVREPRAASELKPTMFTSSCYGAFALNNKALDLVKKGKYEEAEKLNLEALREKEAKLGPDDITTALSQNALGLYMHFRSASSIKWL